VQTPRHPPRQLSAATPPRAREQAILPARPFLKPSKITVKAVCHRRPTGDGQDDQVHVHAKTTLTVILPRFDPAPVGRTARTGLALQVQEESAATAPISDTTAANRKRPACLRPRLFGSRMSLLRTRFLRF
jgi:hypothetical protein